MIPSARFVRLVSGPSVQDILRVIKRKEDNADTPVNLFGHNSVVSDAHVAGCGTEASRAWPTNATPVQVDKWKKEKSALTCVYTVPEVMSKIL